MSVNTLNALDVADSEIGDCTSEFTPRQAQEQALLWVNEQRVLAAEEYRDFAPALASLVAGVAGNSELCPLTLSARMRSVGQTMAHTRETAHHLSRAFELPPAVRAFQEYFDAGFYPQLVCSAADAVEYQYDDGLIN